MIVAIQVTEELGILFPSYSSHIIEVCSNVDWQWLTNDSSGAIYLVDRRKFIQIKTLLDVEGLDMRQGW